MVEKLMVLFECCNKWGEVVCTCPNCAPKAAELAATDSQQAIKAEPQADITPRHHCECGAKECTTYCDVCGGYLDKPA